MASASSNSSTYVQWMWNANENPFSTSHSPEWQSYSDVENMIIEHAFRAGQTHAILDDYHIDFKHNLQISNNDINKQRHVKRTIRNGDNMPLRRERFMSNPIAPKRPYSGLYGFISPFIQAVVKDLNISRDRLPSKNKVIVSFIVERAAMGIIEEGKKLGKQREAELIAKTLIEKKETGMEEVWRCCAYLYSLESFLYKKLNETMRLIGSEEHEQIWRSKVRTLGPFCLLLWDNPFDRKVTKPGTIIYRGAQLPDALINSFKDDYSKDSKPKHSFQAFTSCTRNRNVAESFGNVLFIMEIRVAFTVDLRPVSRYPHEEEELLFPGVCFEIDRIDFDKDKNKYLIYLNLQQRHNKPDLHQLSNNSKPFTETRDSTPADNGADIFFRFIKPSLWNDTKFAADFIAKTNTNLNPSRFPPNFAGNFDTDRDGFDDDWDN
ncbi:unnamed protein product [Rotaria sordida]|uniref:NAD(P)(+)--arginine ADP-ribosyltransferase n=2 Tax=Rotaria sordida TaxID=392033 RepID=A0A814RLJ8_9BILA|nr:unnamed protein product [Rotaria sordida]CAF1134195.1 unnamed protein product [Rotaria sordida]CAF1253555.1 unnamed protein product [Rotaria sordida]